MKIGAVELYLNRPIVMIGSTEPEPGVLDVAAEPAVASSKHVLIRSRVSSQLVEVRIWLSDSPKGGVVVFDGSLDLDDGRLSVSDDGGLWRLIATIHRAGPVSTVIAVDQPGEATLIDVLLDPQS